MASSSPKALSNREEEDLQKLVKSEGLKKCDDVVKVFADCATGRTVSVAWACRSHFKEVQTCLSQYTSPEAVDRARKEWLRTHRT